MAVTASRSEYGLLAPVMTAVASDPALQLQLVVAGAHLSGSHGLTVSAIEADGFPIDWRVITSIDNDSSQAASKSMALLLMGVAEAIEVLHPDIMLLLGDRYEAMAAACAATMMRVPIAHVHGGETTEGAMDEAFRHSITKMSHLHLAAAEQFRRRILQLGEDPSAVHVVGAPGLDNIRELDLATREELSRDLGWDAERPFLLVTHHPVTLQQGAAEQEAKALCSALNQCADHAVLITAPNADPGALAVRAIFEDLASSDKERYRFVVSLGQRLYLSALRHADVVVGNSSSGLIEAPFIGTPTVNIGDRQRGRPRSGSVLDVPADADDIRGAIGEAMRLRPPFSSPYGDGHSGPRIAAAVRDASLHRRLTKRFHDPAGDGISAG